MNSWIGVAKPLVVAGENIASLRFREEVSKGGPALRKQCADSILSPPVRLELAAKAYSPQQMAEASFRVSLCLGECEEATPRASARGPTLDVEFPANDLDIAYEMLRCVGFERRIRLRASAAPLVEKDDPPHGRIVVAPVGWAKSGAGPAMKVEERNAFGIAALLVLEPVSLADWYISAVEWLNGGIEHIVKAHRFVLYMWPLSLGPGVEGVLEAIADEVHGNDGDEDQEAGIDRQQRRRRHQFLSIVQHVAPARSRRDDAEP